jgi:hypothetical protein
MSLAWFIVPEREVDGLDHQVDGKALAHAPEAKLDDLCAKLKVPTLMSFFSINPEEMLELFDVEDPGALAPEQWFKAADGLKTVRALLSHLDKNPKALSKSAAILRDLRDFETVLAGLAKAKVRWHLAIDF